MKKLANILVVAGILLIIYSVLGRLVAGGNVISLGLLNVCHRTGVILANSLLLLAIIIKLWSR